jgi:amino acid transporter
MVGVAANSSTLQHWGTDVTSNGWSMAIGLVEIAILALIMAVGMRLMMRVQLWLFALGSIGFIAAAIVLLTTSRSGFINSYNTYARPFTHKADTYHYFIAQAQKSGVNLSTGTDWHNTMVATGAFIAFGVWVWFSTNLAGEIRQAGTRKNWYSMLGGLACTFVPILIMVALLYHTVGQTFLTAVNGISGNSAVYTLPNAPWWITLVAAIHTNTLFVAFLGLTFVAWAPLIVYIQIVQPVRALFAWSFDQVIPERIASINERTHTPVFTLAVITVCSIPFLYMAAYSVNFLKVVALSTIVGFPTFIMVGISACLFPYRRKAAYEASVSNISLFGLPLMLYFGIGSIIAGLFGAWLWFAYPALGLPRAGQGIVSQLFTSPFRGGLALVAACLIVGAIIYYAGKAWRSSQGIDLSLNYLEIPPE